MIIFLVTDNKKIPESFKDLKSYREAEFSVYSINELNLLLKNAPTNSIIYIDCADLDEPELKKICTKAAKKNINPGFIDTKSKINDPAMLLLKGACDYINRSILKEGITRKRIKTLIDYFQRKENKSIPVIETKKNTNYIPSGKNWDNIRSGREYTFCFMFVELDNHREYKKTYSHTNLTNLMQYFHDFITEEIKEANGTIWMWNEFSGLALFPFDGKSCPSLNSAFKLMLNRAIYKADLPDLGPLLSYRVAMHLGNTTYQPRGNTGRIISDTINSVFHLGQEFTPEGTLTLTTDIFNYISEPLKKWFISAGEFEGRRIMRMKKLDIR